MGTKKLTTIFITVLMVMVLSTPSFAFGHGWREHGNDVRGRGYSHARHDYKLGHEWHKGYYNRSERPVYVRHADRSCCSGAMISLPFVPLPDISQLFPSINVNIH